jgi:hypothetical protein
MYEVLKVLMSEISSINKGELEAVESLCVLIRRGIKTHEGILENISKMADKYESYEERYEIVKKVLRESEKEKKSEKENDKQVKKRSKKLE